MLFIVVYWSGKAAKSLGLPMEGPLVPPVFSSHASPFSHCTAAITVYDDLPHCTTVPISWPVVEAPFAPIPASQLHFDRVFSST